MSARRDPDESGIVTAFLTELLEDRERGALKSLAEYQARYPGFESLIAGEYAAFEVGETEEPAAPPHEAPWSEPEGERYRVEGEVGRGGMGTVHRIWEHRLHRHLAMKRIGTSAAGPHMLRRFLEEARVTAQLHHPGVVPVHELGMDSEGRLYFTMDLVRGRTFTDVIECVKTGADGWNLTRVLDVLQRVCEAVAYAHSKDVVHRDLKPDNVMVGRFGEVYVMDWGLARASEQGGEGESVESRAFGESLVLSARSESGTPLWTLQGEVVGTPAYMAPEQARGRRDVDRRADVYAIGAMLYHLLAGRMPYAEAGEQPASQEVLDRVADGPPRSLRELRPDVPAELVAVCEKAMARDRAERYADVSELREDLRAFLESRVVRAYESGRWAELRKWVRRNRALTAAAALAVLALSLGLVVSLVQTARAQEQTELANASFDDAVAAVERMLTRVGQDALQNVPQAEPVRRQLLQDAVEFFEKFLAERGDDPEVRQRAAWASYRLSTIHDSLGDRRAAEAAGRRALELWQSRLARSPGSREARLSIAMTRGQLGLLALRSGDYEKAESLFAPTLQSIEGLLGEVRDEKALDTAASLLANFAIVTRRGDPDAAIEQARTALEYRQELVERFGEQHLQDLARSRWTLATMLLGKGELVEARQELERAIELYADMAASGNEDRYMRNARATALRLLGGTEIELREYGAAHETLKKATDLARDLAADFPSVASYHGGLGSCLTNLASALRFLGRYEESWNTAVEAIDAIRSALQKAPDHRLYSGSLHLAHRQAYHSARRLRRHQDLAANAEALAAAPQATAPWIVEAARHLTKAASIAVEDQRLDPEMRAARTGDYHGRALELLETAAAREDFDVKLLRHGDFDPLREHERFRSVVEREKGGKR